MFSSWNTSNNNHERFNWTAKLSARTSLVLLLFLQLHTLVCPCKYGISKIGSIHHNRQTAPVTHNQTEKLTKFAQAETKDCSPKVKPSVLISALLQMTIDTDETTDRLSAPMVPSWNCCPSLISDCPLSWSLPSQPTHHETNPLLITVIQ